MLRGHPESQQTAEAVAAWLANDHEHLSHSRAITRDQLRDRGLPITDLEESQELQDAVLSVHHATMHTFNGSAAKLIENHLGRAFIQHGVQMVMTPIQPMPTPAPGA